MAANQLLYGFKAAPQPSFEAGPVEAHHQISAGICLRTYQEGDYELLMTADLFSRLYLADLSNSFLPDKERPVPNSSSIYVHADYWKSWAGCLDKLEREGQLSLENAQPSKDAGSRNSRSMAKTTSLTLADDFATINIEAREYDIYGILNRSSLLTTSRAIFAALAVDLQTLSRSAKQVAAASGLNTLDHLISKLPTSSKT